jgi:LysM repeat protein
MRFLFYSFLIYFSFHTNSFSQNITEHIVEKGENLYLISKKYNVTLLSIFENNPQYEGAILSIGAVVLIPESNQESKSRTNNLENGIHTVISGETKFGLAKKYQITISELEADNPEIDQMLMVGQKIKIRNKYFQNTNPIDTKSSELYLVKTGETLWGLSKRFNLTVAELENANTGLIVGVLKSGQYLRIPTKKSINNNINSDFVHEVKPGETKYGLSKKYGISIAELENMNPHIKNMLIVGHQVVFSKSENNQIIKTNTNQETDVSLTNEQINKKAVTIQSNSPDEKFADSKNENISNNVDVDFQDSKKVNAGTESLLKVNNSNKITEVNVNDVKTISNTKHNLHVFNKLDKESSKTIVFLFDNDLEDFKKNMADSETFKSQKEYYAGVKLALDSLNNLGLKITPVFLNTKAHNKNNNDLNNVYKKGSLVIGPFKKENSFEMLKFLNEMSVKTLIPIELKEFSNDLNAIYSVPTEQHMKLFMLDYLTKLNGNIIIITDVIDGPEANFIRKYYPNIKFAPLDSRGNLNIERFKILFENDVTNHVVMETDKSSLVITSTNYLLTEVNNYSIELALLKERSFLKSKEISDIRYKVLKLKFPSFDFETSKDNLFNSRNRKLFNQDLTSNTVLAFDVTMDGILRLFQLRSMEESLKNEISKQLHTEFKYIRTQNHFWNSAIKINQF